jgi:hypothetical protein
MKRTIILTTLCLGACVGAVLLGAMLMLSSLSHAEPSSAHPVSALEEQRYCGVPKRAADGTIARRTDVLVAFKKAHPCPATGKMSGACGGWAIDHVIPLACGGCDAVSNLQWLPNSIKSSTTGKDRFERKIYCEPMEIVK